jgi:Ulp1 family protease
LTDIIEDEVEEQVKSLLADSYPGINNVPVQQQMNGDCGVFSIAFATCLVYGFEPGALTFDVPKMRPHLFECLRDEMITPFPHI